METLTHDQIAFLAYQLWKERGSPQGSPEVDWHRAVDILESPPAGNVATLVTTATGNTRTRPRRRQ